MFVEYFISIKDFHSIIRYYIKFSRQHEYIFYFEKNSTRPTMPSVLFTFMKYIKNFTSHVVIQKQKK